MAVALRSFTVQKPFIFSNREVNKNNNHHQHYHQMKTVKKREHRTKDIINYLNIIVGIE